MKIFEAMAMGKAVASTTIGAEGLPVTHGRDIIIADQPEDFAHEVVRLVKSRAERDALGKAARQLVESKYSWPAVAATFEEVLADLSQFAARSVCNPKPQI